MNRVEKIVHFYLLDKHPTVKFRSNQTPDFVCSDGSEYEAKKLISNTIVFTERQMNNLTNSNIVLVKEDEIVDIFKFSDLYNTDYNINITQKNPDIVSVSIKKTTKETLKSIKKQGESYDDLLVNLLEHVRVMENNMKCMLHEYNTRDEIGYRFSN